MLSPGEVTVEAGKKGSLFDALEDLDATACLDKAQGLKAETRSRGPHQRRCGHPPVRLSRTSGRWHPRLT